MSIAGWITLSILIVMFALLIKSKLPAWLIFVGTLTVMMTLKLAPEDALLKGFANSGVITVGVLFIVAAGMYSTGAISLLSDKLIGLPKTLRDAQLKVLPPTAVGSAFLNNTPLVAMMVPVIRDLTRTAQLAGSLLYMPLSFSSILGGASTLIGTSTNLIIAGLVLEEIARGRSVPGMRAINIFDPTLVGGPAAVVGIAFIVLLGTRLLPKPKAEAEEEIARRLYKTELHVRADSPLIGKTIQAAGLFQAQGYQLVDYDHMAEEEIDIDTQSAKETSSRRGLYHRLKSYWKRKEGQAKAVPEKTDDLAGKVIQAGDVLSLIADADAIPGLWSTIGLEPVYGSLPAEGRFRHRLVEVVVAPGHPAIGRTISELPVREHPPYNAEIVAISRNNQPPEERLGDFRIQAGDVGILEVEDNFFYETRSQIEFSLTRRLRGYQIQRTSRATIANLITLAMILLAAFGVMSMLNAALLAAGALLLTGCLSVRAAWRSIEFETLVVLGAAIGLEAAITNSGLSAAIANLLNAIGGGNPYIALTVVFCGAIVMTNLITNAAAAAFMFPITVSMASQMGVNFMPFVIVLMMGCSYAFINPTGYQTNLMVQGPGGYKFADFTKLGLPLTILVGIVVIILAPLIFRF